MLKVLVTYAVQGEFAEIQWQDAQLYYVRTGIGKVKSAYHLLSAIRQVQPDLVINMGTAGSLSHPVGEILVCRNFVDRDLQKVSSLNLEYRIDSGDLLTQRGYCLHWGENSVCNTGDSFLTEVSQQIEGDVFDMEAYAQAMVCRQENVPFVAVKYVSDIIGQNSVKQWEEKLSDARQALGYFFNVLKERI